MLKDINFELPPFKQSNNGNNNAMFSQLNTNSHFPNSGMLNVNAKSYHSPKHAKAKEATSNSFNSFSTFAKGKVIEVYADNFVKEIKRIGKYLKTYNFIGMDTEFPGIVYPCPTYTPDFYYQFTKANVDKLKWIQLGITWTNEKGETPSFSSTWQFNLSFNHKEEKHSVESISLLTNCGIDFDNLRKNGIPYELFAEYFLISDLVLNEHVTWISFNGWSDFSYWLKLLTNDWMPERVEEFDRILNTYFPNVYDIKVLLSGNETFKGGWNKIAKDLKIERMGETHQAGSDSMWTSAVFFGWIKINEITSQDLSMYKNAVFGVGQGADDNETITYTQFANESDMVHFYANNMRQNHFTNEQLFCGDFLSQNYLS